MAGAVQRDAACCAGVTRRVPRGAGAESAISRSRDSALGTSDRRRSWPVPRLLQRRRSSLPEASWKGPEPGSLARDAACFGGRGRPPTRAIESGRWGFRALRVAAGDVERVGGGGVGLCISTLGAKAEEPCPQLHLVPCLRVVVVVEQME